MFLWLTKLVDSLFQSDWAARVIPFLAGMGAVVMFGLICRATLAGMARWLAWAVFCVAYVPVVEGTRVKGYTIDLLLATVMLWLMLRWLLEGRKARYLVGLALCAPVFVWMSYTSVFIIGAVGFVFAMCLVKPFSVPDEAQTQCRGLGWGNVSAGLAFVALAAISVMFLYELNIRPGLEASVGNGLADSWKRGYPPDRPWRIPLWLVRVHTGRGFAWPVGGNDFCSSLTCGLWLTGLVVYWRRGNRRVWALLVGPQVLSLAAAFLHKYPYLQNPRLCMFLGPGICLFAGSGAQYLMDLIKREKWRRRCYVATALALGMCAVGGLGRDIVMRMREVNGPGIRSTLAEASRLVGPDGQFALLNDESNSGVFSYYIRREVKQKVLRNGEMPTATGPGQRLALVAIGTEISDPKQNPLLGDFARRWGRPIKVMWSQTAHQVLQDTKDRLVVWVCE
jgi:hypothetical protein